MTYLLDTDICIFFLKNRFSIEEKIKSVGIRNCFISEITIIELMYGAKKSENYERHANDVNSIQKLFQVIPISTCHEIFVKEKYRLQKHGLLIPDFDLLIAATASSNAHCLVSNNEKHLKRVKNIALENWTKPEYNFFLSL